MQRFGLATTRRRPRAGVAVLLGLLVAFAGAPAARAAPAVFSYTGPPVSIPDAADLTGTNPGAPVSVPIVVSGLGGSLTDIDFRIDGDDCLGASTVGIEHTYVGDVDVSLTSPAGTTVVLMRQAGGSGDHFCQVLLDDQSTGPSIQPASAVNAPFTGSWKPYEPLAAFNGEDPNGMWTVTVQDFWSFDTGTIRAVSLLLSAPGTPTLTGQASADTLIGGAPLTDTVTLADRIDPQADATVLFQLFGPADPTCAGTPLFSSTVAHPVADGPVTSAAFSPTVAGTYRWVAAYSGDANNRPVAGACGDAGQSVHVGAAPPPIAPKPTHPDVAPPIGPKPADPGVPPATSPPSDVPPPVAVASVPPRSVPAPKRRAKVCTSRRRLTLRLIRRKGFRVNLRRARILRVTLANARGKRIKQRSTATRATVDLRGLPKGRFTVRIKVRLRTGKRVTFVRHYKTCSAPATVRVVG